MAGALATRVRGRSARELDKAMGSVRRRAAGVRRRTPTGVALTFDDGPVAGGTDRVLDVLGRLRVPATFFCVGRNAERSPALLRRIAAEGHAVGSHSLTHPHPRDLTVRQVAEEYASGRAAVEQVLGAPVPLFRPPHGHLSLRTALVLRSHRPWLWSTDPQDWRPGVPVEHVERVAGSAADRDVVLLHDWVEQPVSLLALDRSATVDALPAVVAALRGRGVEFVRLSA